MKKGFEGKGVEYVRSKPITPLHHHTDQELVELMKAGHRHAFNEIYERYWFRLYTAAVKRLISRDDAKDIVQDLFCSIWVKRDSLVISTSLSAYLFTAIKYRIINYIESNITKAAYLSSLDRAVMDYDNSANEAIIGRDLEAFLESGIKTLSPNVKKVFELSRKEHLSVREISERLHISDQTVKNQISKALKVLRVHLSDISAALAVFVIL